MIRVPLIPPRSPLYRGHNISISKIVHQEYDIYLASWEHTKWLVLSSSFFLFPSMFAFYHHLYFHSFLLCSTSIISANYWRKPTYSWRRTMDLLFSKISFSWFFLHGVFYIHSTPHLIFAVSNTCLFSSCFILSSYYFYKDQDICRSEDIWSEGICAALPSTTNFIGCFALRTRFGQRSEASQAGSQLLCRPGEVWYKYHFLFHTLMTLEQYHILLHILL